MNGLRSLTILAVAAFFSAAALSAPATFNTDPNHTFVRFSYNHMGFTTQEQRFNKVSGTVTLDEAAKTGAVDIVIDAKSIDTGSDLFNGHIQGEDYLDTTNFPTATFKSTAVKFSGLRPASIDGNLTIKGITKPVTLTVTSYTHGPNMMKKDAIGADATTTVKRSDFNMGKYVPMVGDDVKISISIEAYQP
jgi:polyisoprenoid-binding protein YceI